MIGVIVALVFLVGSLCLMSGVIIANQINPSYGSALGVPIYNALSIVLALLGLVTSVFVYRKNKDMKLAKRTMVLGVICVVVLVLLFPLSNMGYLSRVH